MDLVIGGGITGLSYAMFNKNKDYIVVERENEVGGYCRTITRNGYIWDYSGHFFHFQDDDIKKLVLGNLVYSNGIVEVEKNTYIRYKNRFIDYPFQKNIHQLPYDEFLDCLVDLFAAHDEGYSSFKEMLYKKYGRSIAEKFLVPYNEKLYACNLDFLDKDSMGRFFPKADKEEIISNFRRQNNQSYNGTFLYPRKGAIDYVNSICGYIDPMRIHTGMELRKVYPKEHIAVFSGGKRIKYDNLISTIPFPLLLDIIGVEYDSRIYSWNKVLVCNLGFDRKGPDKKSHWVYYPEREYCFYRVGFYDNILNSERSSLYVEIGFNKDAIISPQKWLNRVLSDLILAGCISDDMILLDYEFIIMNPAYVHITKESINDVREKKQMLSKDDIYSIGRYGSWTYCSIEDNIKEARSLSISIQNRNE